MYFPTQTEINQMRQTGNHFIMHILQEGIVLFKWEEEITSPFSWATLHVLGKLSTCQLG